MPDLHDTISGLADERDRLAESTAVLQTLTDQRLRDALREWGAAEFGTVDGLCREVADRTGYTVAHVKNDLTYPKGGKALAAAVELFRERTAAEPSASAPLRAAA